MMLGKEDEVLGNADLKDRPRAFALLVQKITQAYRKGEISSLEAAQAIRSNDLPEVAAIPEMAYVLEMACDLDDNYYFTDSQREEAWQRIESFLQSFLEGKRQPSYFELVAYYEEKRGECRVSSVSLRAKVLEGKLVVEIPVEKIKVAAQKTTEGLRAEDAEDYLQKVADALPAQVEEYALREAKVRERLVEYPPYL